MRRAYVSWQLIGVLLSLALLGVSGCGSAGAPGGSGAPDTPQATLSGDGPTGSVTIRVRWPMPDALSREIPSEAQTIYVRLYIEAPDLEGGGGSGGGGGNGGGGGGSSPPADGGGNGGAASVAALRPYTIASTYITRPASEATLEGVPATTLGLAASAHTEDEYGNPGPVLASGRTTVTVEPNATTEVVRGTMGAFANRCVSRYRRKHNDFPFRHWYVDGGYARYQMPAEVADVLSLLRGR